MQTTGDRAAKGSCKSNYQIYLTDEQWPDAIVLNGPPPLFYFWATGMPLNAEIWVQHRILCTCSTS